MINFVFCVGRDFLTDESEAFWLNIAGHYEQKVQEIKLLKVKKMSFLQ